MSILLHCSEEAELLATLLTKMCLKSQVSEDGNKLLVEVPPTRTDILSRLV